MEAWYYLLAAVQDARLMGGFLLLIVAALGWYAGLSRVPLSIAFPIAALTYPLMFLGATVILREDYSWPGLMGNCLIVIGVLVASLTQ
jgi:drug/metabolite transporter (DMT)-like permease